MLERQEGYFPEGDPAVLRNFLIKRNRLAEGDARHSEINFGLLVLHGAFRGTHACGHIKAMAKRKLNEVPDHQHGVSTGGPEVCYNVTGDAHFGTIYPQLSMDQEFSNPWYAWKGNFLNCRRSGRIFRSSSKALSVAKLGAARGHITVPTTIFETGEDVVIDVKAPQQDVFDTLEAGTAIPIFSRPVALEGINGTTEPILCCDGAIAQPLPVRYMIEELGVRDLLIFTNRAPDYRDGDGFFYGMLESTLAYLLPSQLRKAIRRRSERFDAELKYLRNQEKCRYFMVWADHSVDAFERDPWKLRFAARRAEEWMTKWLDRAEREFQPA